MPLVCSWIIAATGLGLPTDSSPRALQAEQAVRTLVHQTRKAKKLKPLTRDATLEAFARNAARRALLGEISAPQIHKEIQNDRVAPGGYYLLFGTGPSAKRIPKKMRTVADNLRAMRGNYHRVGVGAYAQGKFIQVLVLLARSVDPKDNRPGLTTAQTDSVMSKANGRFLSCYNRALNEDPNLHGQIVMRLVIDGRGRVKDARLLKELADKTFSKCAVAVASQLQFPKPYKGKDVTLNHSIQFSADHGNRHMGKLTRGQVRNTFMSAESAYYDCYDERLSHNPFLKGVIEIAATVTPDGVPKQVHSVRDELNDPTLTGCVIGVTSRLRFPKPQFGGDVDVQFPLRFRPEKGVKADN